MSIIINNNGMAANTARNLSATYGKLSTNIQRLSTGLRVNSAADDAAGLAIREMMRADITATQQGIRNAADAISMIQTADGALGVIDEKLTRMKELAEQASTGTYTTVQRDIINSEYQAMAAEIDRIANATNFNGIKLLDGSVSNQHGGQGIKIHFGTSNNAAEDYYFINIGDARATSSTGLRVGGDAKNDIWGQGGVSEAGGGCCAGGFGSLSGAAGFNSGQTFSYGYNWDWTENEDTELLSGKYLAGRYTVNSSDSLQDLVDKVNAGTQSRVGIEINSANLFAAVGQSNSGTVAVCIGDESYYFGQSATVNGTETSAYKTAYSGTTAYATDGQLMTSSDVVAEAFSLKSAFASTTLDGEEDRAAGANALNNSLSKGFSHTVSVADTATAAAAADVDTWRAAKGLATTTSVANRLHSTASAALAAWSGAAAAYMDASASLTSAAAHAMVAADEGVADIREYLMNETQAVRDGYKTLETGVYTNANHDWTSSEALVPAAQKAGWNGETKVDIDAEMTGFINEIAAAYSASTLSLDSPPDATGLQDDIEGKMTSALVAVSSGTSFTAAAFAAAHLAGLEISAGGTASQETEYLKKEGGIVDYTKEKIQVAGNRAGQSAYTATALASAINANADSEFWAMVDQDNADRLYVFHKDGGNNNDIKVCEEGGRDAASQAARGAIRFEHVESGQWNNSGTTMSLGGEKWATMTPQQTTVDKGTEVWNVTLEGRDVGRDRDLWIANTGDLITPNLDEGIINGMDRDAFQEIQNADNASWKGAEVRTQSSAQEALDALSEAIVNKDKIRADLGALQNRLENTMTNLEVQAENIQAAESRISDVDVAKEMTEFTKNNVLTQAAVGMLGQANSMSQLALSLIG
jgi:flagellin